MLLDDRGPAKYFHGREIVIGRLREVLKEAEKKENWSGTIFLVQGPPGVGKTALLSECRKIAFGWESAEIELSALWHPSKMREGLERRMMGIMSQVTGVLKCALGPVEAGMDFGKNEDSVVGILKKTKKTTPAGAR